MLFEGWRGTAGQILVMVIGWRKQEGQQGRRLTRGFGRLRASWVAGLVTLGVAVLISTANAQTVTGRVVGVHDGDTITLLDASKSQHKIRLDGIDAPELGQPFGRASKASLAQFLGKGEAVAECHKIDQYGRRVCRVLAGGRDAGVEQLRAGMAWYFRRYERELAPERRQVHAELEAAAKEGRRGLWSDAEPVPPWDWRARGR